MNVKKTLYDESLPPDNMSAHVQPTEIVERMKELFTEPWCSVWTFDYRDYVSNR